MADRARWQLENGPHGRTEDGGRMWATPDVLSSLIALADGADQ
jgi:hypothetical protein